MHQYKMHSQLSVTDDIRY